MERSARVSEIVARIAFTAVFTLNVMCALQFIVAPGEYVGAYQLESMGAEAAIQGYGVVFLMWNVTYPLFIFKPLKHLALGAIILVQQLIGCIGETCILLTLPAEGADLLASSIQRFIAFDAGGLIVMIVTFIWLYSSTKESAGTR